MEIDNNRDVSSLGTWSLGIELGRKDTKKVTEYEFADWEMLHLGYIGKSFNVLEVLLALLTKSSFRVSSNSDRGFSVN